MTKKIFQSMVSVSIAILFISIIGISFVLYDYFGDIIKTEIKNEAILISQNIDGLDEYEEKADMMMHRVTLIDKEGVVLFDTKVDSQLMENHSNREEFIAARNNGEAFCERYSDTLDSKTIYYARKLSDGNILRVAQEHSTIAGLQRGLIGSILVILIIMIVIVFLISKSVSKKIVKPINEIDINKEEPEEPYPEIAPLIKRIKAQNHHIDMQMDDLRRSQKEFEAITEHMSEGFLLIDSKTEILSYNNSAIEILNRFSEYIPDKVLELNRSKSFRTAIEEALEGKHVQVPLETDNKYYNVIANPVVDEDRILGVAIMLVDMTEKEQREKLRREFTSNVSHELKTPLTTIYGVSDMMAEGIVKNEDMKGFANNIREESGRMISLIDDIIKLSKLDENNEDDAVSEISLLSIAKDVIDSLKFKAEEKNIGLYLQGDDVKFNGIPSLLYEIIYNLCENGIKYNKENGSVIITLKEDEENVTIIVEDSGMGIPYEYKDRIFERFFRIDKSRSQKVSGTGLGLSIVKHAVNHMNGNVEVESVLNEGSKITVTFKNNVKY